MTVHKIATPSLPIYSLQDVFVGNKVAINYYYNYYQLLHLVTKNVGNIITVTKFSIQTVD